MADDDKVKLQSQDNTDFEIEVRVAKMSETVCNLIEDAGIANPIPLPNVTGAILSKVIEYCTHYTKTKTDLDFGEIDQAKLFELILAANYLDIKPLLDVTCSTVANMIKGKTPDEIRKTFNIKNDFTPEEEEQVRKENEWCEEK